MMPDGLDPKALPLETTWGTVASLPVSLSNTEFTDSGNEANMAFLVPAGAATLDAGGLLFGIPALEGVVNRNGPVVSTEFDAADGDGALAAKIRATYDLDSGRGSGDLTEAVLSFDRQDLAPRVGGWSYPFDLVAGRTESNADVEWAVGEEETAYSGTFGIVLRSLAGHLNDLAFAGVDGRLIGAVDSADGITVTRSDLDIALFDVGTPIENIATVFSIDADRTLSVDSLTMDALGGRISTDPFTLNPDPEPDRILVSSPNQGSQVME